MVINREPIELLYKELPQDAKEMLDRAIESIVSAKKKVNTAQVSQYLAFTSSISYEA